MAKRRQVQRWLRAGEAVPQGAPSRCLKGGYVRLVWTVAPYRQVAAYEHRVLAGAREGEHVHHRNGVRWDNRPENLEVLTAREHRERHGWRSVDFAQAARLYAAGLSTHAVARRLGVAQRSVWEGLRRRVPMRSLLEAQRLRRSREAEA